MNKDNLEELRKSFTIDQINSLLEELGGEPREAGDYITSKTICHGGESRKLYYYDNTKLFHCYTNCDSSFDVFELVTKVKNTRGEKVSYGEEIRDWQLFDSVRFIKKFFNLSTDEEGGEGFSVGQIKDWETLEKYEENYLDVNKRQIIDLITFDESVIANFPTPHIVPWEKEGITPQVLKDRNIHYNPISNGIIIPHYDIKDQLVGIRERTLTREREQYGKYYPAIIGKVMYNHPLGYNLYNINYSKDNIRRMKKVIIGEGEKFCMTFASYFGEDADITVACCGSSITDYQFSLLLSLGAEEVIIAFDKQFQKIGDDEFKKWVKKLTTLYQKYSSYAVITFMFDKWGMLGYKDSPVDCGKSVFLDLFSRRFSL